ncbi:MAG: sugar kinase, partial [Alphaproteobacteria bacterium]|nr:sugar kinase [Alphaproteobacteria bacterium]
MSVGDGVMKRIACIGECMIELFEDAASGSGTMRRTWGGDTLNSAVYLARELAGTDAKVHYVTVLGDDPYSTEMLAGWAAEGIDTDLTERLPGALPGLYMIRVDERGERDFLYWRDRAAARQLFITGEAERTLAELAGFDWLYFSGITLAILSIEGRAKLMTLCQAVRGRGGQVVFDSNFRPGLWPDRE